MTALGYPSPELTDGVVLLRPWTVADVPCVQTASHETRIHAGTTVPHTDDVAAALVYIERQRSRSELGEGWSLAVAEATTGIAIGQAFLGFRPQDGVLGTGYWLLPAARGHGYGRRAVRLLAGWGLESARAARIEAWVEPDNPPSQRLLESCGFVREGLLRSFMDLDGRRADVYVYSRLPGDPVPPLEAA